MRQRLFIVISLIVVVVVLVALNAASYVKVENTSDSEQSPDRSTFNSGATGTRALYEFLRESNFQVARWRESPSSLLSIKGPKPATLVITGRTIIPITASECEEILGWVKSGGRLVLIDRYPNRDLLPASGAWRITTLPLNDPFTELDPSNLEQMTGGVSPVQASQPTALAYNVGKVMPSRFAAAINIAPRGVIRLTGDDVPDNEPNDVQAGPSPDDSTASEEPSPKPAEYGVRVEEGEAAPNVSPAPVVHFEHERGALLVDYRHGEGRIVVLSDPYIVANNGIGRADNLMLAINVAVGQGGLVAFDEFHQGRGITNNALIQYFSGTPVLAIGGQFALIALAIVWTRGRRFARPLPLPHVDRRSSLEFVASMAELQQRAKAHDLALENIYGRVRRVLVRHAGLSNTSARADIAGRVAQRSGLNRQKLESLMRNCEDIINGAPTNAKESLRLARRLRDIESTLGLGTRSREARQEKTGL